MATQAKQTSTSRNHQNLMPKIKQTSCKLWQTNHSKHFFYGSHKKIMVPSKEGKSVAYQRLLSSSRHKNIENKLHIWQLHYDANLKSCWGSFVFEKLVTTASCCIQIASASTTIAKRTQGKYDTVCRVNGVFLFGNTVYSSKHNG